MHLLCMGLKGTRLVKATSRASVTKGMHPVTVCGNMPYNSGTGVERQCMHACVIA